MVKLNHNWNGWTPNRTDAAWAARIEREAARTTDQAEADHQRMLEREQRARERLSKAEDALAVARAKRERGKRLRALADAAEARRQELEAIHREMTASPASAQHRGRGAHRGVATGGLPL